MLANVPWARAAGSGRYPHSPRDAKGLAPPQKGAKGNGEQMASQTQAQLTKFMACPQKKGKKTTLEHHGSLQALCAPPQAVYPPPQLVTTSWFGEKAPRPSWSPGDAHGGHQCLGLILLGTGRQSPPAILRGCCGKPGLCLCWLFNILLQPLISFTTSSAAPNTCNQGTERKSRPGPALPGKGHLHPAAQGCWHQLPNRHHKEDPGHNPPYAMCAFI